MTEQKVNRIVIVEDQKILRHSLQTILDAEPDFHVVAALDDAEAIWEHFDDYNPDVVLMDIFTRNSNGLMVSQTIKERYPHVKVIILTGAGDNLYMKQAFDRKIDGFIHKDCDIDNVKAVIRQALSEFVSFPRSVHDIQEESLFSEKEMVILDMLCQYKDVHDIADLLDLKPATVNTYISEMMHKCDVNSRIKLIAYALNSGLVTPSCKRH